jgi:hypothetical protein
LSPQQRVEPLNRRINDLDKQIKATKSPSKADLKEIATLEKGRIDTENTIRTSLFQAVGGLLVFVTLYISWLTLKANEAKQVAERFSKAVEQLGNDDNIHVRLGGIYALEQIAKDAEEKYYWQVMETLTSYVRVRSPYPAKKRSLSVQAAIDAIKSDTQSEEDIPPLPIDIQAVMTVLARRKYSYGHYLELDHLDLRRTDLRRLYLDYKAKLAGVDLGKANLKDAFLAKVDLRHARLWDANLQNTQLWEANLQGAELPFAKLRRANLLKAKLEGANFQGADLQGANLEGTMLEGAISPNNSLTQQPQAETDRSTKQATESAQAEGETAATPTEETQLTPPES